MMDNQLMFPSGYSFASAPLEVKGSLRGKKYLDWRTSTMPKYVIDREIPGAGQLSETDLSNISHTSCGVLRELGPEIQWVNSFVTDNKIYCIYIAPNEELIRQHAEKGGFPANSIAEVKSIIDPTSAK